MMDVIRKITISEVILLFNLLFVLPLLALMLLRIRRYEKLYGVLPDEGKFALRFRRKKKAAPPPKEKVEAAPVESAPAAGAIQYRTRAFLAAGERNCLKVMLDVLGNEVDVFPKVALWETVEPVEGGSAAMARLHGLDYDFLVCDKTTGQPLTGVMFKGGRGKGRGASELEEICKAAGASVVFIEMSEDYNAKKMKEALRIPDLELD